MNNKWIVLITLIVALFTVQVNAGSSSSSSKQAATIVINSTDKTIKVLFGGKYCNKIIDSFYYMCTSKEIEPNDRASYSLDSSDSEGFIVAYIEGDSTVSSGEKKFYAGETYSVTYSSTEKGLAIESQ